MQYAKDSLNVDNLVQRLREIRATVELTSPNGLLSLQLLENRFPDLSLPADFLNFFKNCDGVRMTYSMPHGRPDKRSIPVGIFEIVASKHLQLVESRIFLKGKMPLGMQQVDSRGSGGGQQGHAVASRRVVSIRAVPFERVPDLGVVALVYAEGQTAQPTIWIRDTTLQWHYICRNFSCYYRLAMIHMAVARWQSMFMPQGLDSVAKSWLAKLNPRQLHFDASRRAELVSGAGAAASLYAFSATGGSHSQVNPEDPDDQEELEQMWRSRESSVNDAKSEQAAARARNASSSTTSPAASSDGAVDFARLDELMKSQSRSKAPRQSQRRP